MNPALVLSLVALAGDVGAEGALAGARQAVRKQDWSDASRYYEQAAAELPQCGALEYDTGTAAAEAGQVGLAVLHLERALREHPWDSDARQNLERIRAKRVDKVLGQEPGESPIQRVAAGLPGRWLFWLSLLLCWAGFAIWFARWIARANVSSGWIVLSLAVSAVFFTGALAAQEERGVRYAVVVTGAQGVKVHSGPAADLPSGFEVHDGLKVLVLGEENGFTRIRLGNGLEGFVPQAEIQEI